MKKLVLLTSVLALAACGGGSGGSGGTPAPIWHKDTVITKDMLDNIDTEQSREIVAKLQTIEYVENNLESIIDGGVLSTPSIRSARSATINELDSGLALSDIESRYQHALEYFGVLNKVLGTDINTSAEITVKDIKIAYSLSANKKYEDLTNDDLPFIDIDNEDDETVITIDAGFRETQIAIKENCIENDNLHKNTPEDILADIITPAPPYKFDFSGKTFEYSEEYATGRVVFTTNESGSITDIDFSLVDKFIDNSPDDNRLTFIAYETCWKMPTEFGSRDYHITTATEITTDEQLRELAIKDLKADADPEELDAALAYAENLTLKDVDIQKISYEGDLTFWGNQIGLKYSDIGDLKLIGTVITESGINTDIQITHMMIAGGDENRIIAKESLSPDNKYEFSGRAHAILTAKDDTKMSDNKGIKYINTSDAKLVFDATKGTETLTMDFTDWYDVEISKDNNDEFTAKISNDDNDEIDPMFQEYDNNKTIVSATIDAKYYGAGATPEESIANFGLETWSQPESVIEGKTLSIQGVFGGVK